MGEIGGKVNCGGYRGLADPRGCTD